MSHLSHTDRVHHQHDQCKLHTPGFYLPGACWNGASCRPGLVRFIVPHSCGRRAQRLPREALQCGGTRDASSQPDDPSSPVGP